MAGYTEEVAPLMNLTKETMICKLLQPVMREVRNKRGKTQLWYYCENGMTASVVRMLEMKSIDVEGRKEGGWEDECTCLMIAANNGHLDICRLLIDKGAQVTAKISDGWTPLHYAASHGHVEIVRLFCDHEADVEARDNIGWRPLHRAAFYGYNSVVKELIEEGNADVNARNGDGRTALRLARHKPDIAAYLISHGGIE
jgi:ankyrin repeat protein